MAERAPFQFSGKYVAAMLAGMILGVGLWSWWNSDSHVRQTARAERVPAAQSKDLDLVEFAVRRVRSWRATMAGTSDGSGFETTQEVFCPYELHTVTLIRTAGGGSEVAREVIATKDNLYTHQGTDPWTSQPGDGKDQCQNGPIAGPDDLLQVLDRLKPTTSVSKGATVAVEGKSCRIWQLFSRDSGNALGSLCVEDFTHLPLEFRLGQVRVEYSNWNEPVLIEAPEVPHAEKPGPAQP
jgi:hypothetical protein